MKLLVLPVNVVLMGIVLWMSSPLCVYGQLADPVKFHIDTLKTDSAAEAGAILPVTVNAVIEEGWHLYSILNAPELGPIPTSFSSARKNMIIAGDLRESVADIAYDPNFDAELGWHSQSAVFIVPVQFDPSLEGQQKIEIDVYYQVCDDVSCLPPVTRNIQGVISLHETDRAMKDREFSGTDYGTGTTIAMKSVDSSGIDYTMVFVLIIFLCLLTGAAGSVFQWRRNTDTG